MRRILPEQVPFAEGLSNQRITTLLVTAAVIFSVVGFGFVASAGAVGTADDTEAAQEDVLTQATVDSTDDFLLEYADNNGNSATIEGNGVLAAVSDFRDDDLDASELFAVVNFFRTGEPLLEVQFNDQDSLSGETVTIDSVSVADLDDDNSSNEFIVAVENSTGSVLAESTVLSGDNPGVELDGLDLDIETGDDSVNLTAAIYDVDADNRGAAYQVQGDRIEQTAEVDPVTPGQFIINTNESELDKQVTIGEDASVEIAVDAITGTEINGTLDISQVDGDYNDSRNLTASQTETINETFTIPTADLNASETFEFQVNVTTDTNLETPLGPTEANGSVTVTAGELNGTVTASGLTDNTVGGGEGIEDATIEIYANQNSDDGDPDFTFENATNQNGSYDLVTVPSGDHFVVADADDFSPEGANVSVSLDTPTTQDFELNYSDTGSISGDVALDFSAPDEDVNITVEITDDTETIGTETIRLNGSEDTATYTFDGLDVDVDNGYTVTATTDTSTYNDTTVENVTVDVGAETEQDLTLERVTGTVSGQVVASGDTDFGASQVPEGEGIEDATIEIYPFNTSGDNTPVEFDDATDADGNFTVEVPIGTHGIAADATDFSASAPTSTGAVEEGNETDVGEITLDYADVGSINGTITLAQPAPAGGISVTVTPDTADTSATLTFPEGVEERTYTLGDLPVQVGDGFDVTASVDTGDFADQTESGVIVEPGETTPNVDFEFSFLAFNDQATNSSQLNSPDRTGPAVVVEDVGGTEDSTLLVTFENETGSTIVAGVEEPTDAQLNGSNVAVPIDNTTGFPGDHTARLVPDADRSGPYAPGDVLSGNTTDAVVASETATIYQGTVNIEDQSFDNATSQVEINTSNLVPNDDYVIVVHETNSNGAPSAKIGNSSDLNGQANNVTVQLNDGEEINETADIAAMLHFASDDGPFGPPVRNADTSGFVGGNVVDVAEVEITATFDVTIDNTTSPVAEGENLNVNVTVENVGGQEENQTINLTEFNGNAIGEDASDENVTLGIGENETIKLTFPTESGDGGTGDIVVESEDDSDRQNVTVTTDAFFDVSITSVTDPVNAGENITVRYEVENTGDNADTQDVTFLVDNEQEGINNGVALEPGEIISDSFSFATDSNRTDNVALAVNSNNDTETQRVEVVSQPNFDVSINSVNDPVFEGDDLVVNVTVENTGDRADTQTINLTGFDGAVQDSRSPGLDGGENVTFELTLPTVEGDGSADPQEINVTSEDDVATESVTVDRPAFFDVSITSVSPNPVAADDDVTVEYEVENTGTVSGTQDIVFEVVNETIDVEEDLELNSSETNDSLSFEYESNQSDIDRSPITVRVLSDDDVDSRAVEVNEQANFNVSEFTVDEKPVFENQAYNVSATVTNTGGVTASQDIEYRLGGVENATNSSVSLDPGNSTTVEFSLDEPDVTVDSSSEFEHGVFSADDNATRTLTVEPFDDADFNITVFDTDEQISQGENLTIDKVTVENEGNATATQDINFTVTQDGSENVSVTLVENVTLDGEGIDGTGGDSNTITNVRVDTFRLDTGDYNQTVSTLNDSSEANLTVIQGTTFDVSGLSISGQDADAEVDSGASPSEIRFTVKNTGDRSGSATIDLNVSIDGEPVIEDTTTTDVSLTPGDTIETEFKNVDLGSLDPDGYTVEVSTDDNSVSGDLTVDGLAVRDLDIDNQNATATVREDNNFAVNATIENTGSVDKTQDIVLNITDNSGTLVANATKESVTITEDSSKPISFTGLNLDVNANSEDFTVTVSSQNETTEGDLTIEPLNFAVDIGVQNKEIEIGEGPTQVDITLDNQADQQLNRTLELEVVDNETGNATDVSDSREITLNADDVLTTSLELNTGELVNDDYTINATTDTDEDSVAFDVNPAPVSNLDQVEGFETLEAALGNVSTGETLRIDDVTLDSEPDNLTLSNSSVRIFGQGDGPSSVSTDLNVTGDDNTLENFTIEGNLTLDGANNNADNVTVTGSITNAGLGPDQASSGNVFVNDDATLNGVTADELVVASGATAEVSDTTAQTVSNNGTVTLGNNVANLSSGGVFSSIQAAVGNAGSDDTVTVQPGTYEESVTVDVEGLTLEGPNAGIAGDSNQRGAEATITDANGDIEINAANVTVDGFNFEFDRQAIQSKSGSDNLITNNRFELTDNTSNQYAIRVGDGSPGTDVTNNLFTDIVSDTPDDNVNGVVVTNPRETTVADNTFSSVDTAVNIGAGSSSESGEMVVEDNEFSDVTQFGAVLVNNDDPTLDLDVNNNTIQSSEVGVLTFTANDGATFSIQDNDFQNFANDEVFVDDSAGVLTLDDVLNNQGNTFDPDGEVVSDQIRVNGTAPADTVVNLDSGQTFTGGSAVQDAVDVAGQGDTIRVGPGEFQGPVQVIDDQTNLTIRSAAGPENTVINATDGSARSTPSFNVQAVRISVDGVTIDGFNIVGDDTIVSGVFVAGGDGGGDNVRVVNNIIEGMSRPGFGGPSDNSAGIVTAAFGGGDPEVVDGFVARNNTIRDIGSNAKKPNNPDDGTRAQGISLIDIAGDTAGDGAVIENNTISGLAGQDTTTGIAVQPLDRPTNNGTDLDPGVVVRGNDISDADIGLALGDEGALEIANNTFTDVGDEIVRPS